MTRGEYLIKKRKCEKNHCSAMSNIAWCDLSNNNILRLQDYCPNSTCKCQEHITFHPKQFQLEGAGFKKTRKRLFKGSQTAWNKFLKPAINRLTPVIGLAVGAKSKNKQVGAATTNILKSLPGGKILSLIYMHRNGLRLKVM